MENNRKILIFEIGVEKERQLRDLCKSLDIIVCTVDKTQYSEALGALAGIKGIALSGKHYSCTGLNSEMMVFSGIAPEDLDVFLDAYKKAGIVPTPLKAVMTPFNVRWSAYQLEEELLKEHMNIHE